jgi:hypothetical protein
MGSSESWEKWIEDWYKYVQREDRLLRVEL